jgi:uncharacterized repeat protein (TIGR03847 family)
MDELLQEIAGPGSGVIVPTQTPAELVDNEPLDQPVEEQFRAGVMRLGWDPRTAQIIIEAYPLASDDENDDENDDEDGEDAPAAEPDALEPREMLLIRIPVGTARAFVERTRQVVRAGRPTCPICGAPVDPDGHVCAPSDV